MEFRPYDPAVGTFTGIDPVTHHCMSAYMAFDGNPVFWSDPSGADAVGADGLTNDQWVQLSRPGGGGPDAMRAQARVNFSEAARDRYANSKKTEVRTEGLTLEGFSDLQKKI